MRVVQGAAENLFHPPVSNHMRARVSTLELPNPEVSFAKRRRSQTKSPSNVAVHDTSSSCLPTSHDNDVHLDSDDALLVHCLNDGTLGFPMGCRFVDVCFSLESAHAEVTTCDMHVLCGAQFMKAQNDQCTKVLSLRKRGCSSGRSTATGQSAPKPDWYCKVSIPTPSLVAPQPLLPSLAWGKNLRFTLAASEGLQSAPQTRRLYVQLPKIPPR